jgi:hypothetical protein
MSSASAAQQEKRPGLEKRTSILPTPAAEPMGPGLLGPDYSFADNLALPGQVGVRDGDDMASVIDSVKAIGYYVDMIGFGESSSGLSKGVGPRGGPTPLGVRTWMKTGLKCSNGAEMWMYMDGVPTGNALGKRIKDGLASANLPGMRGLAPGIVEDAQSALDPMPILKTAFGTGYPQCRLEAQLVGDQDGVIKNPTTGAYYMPNPETVYQKDGRSYQKRWVHDRDLTKADWNNAAKTHCPDGYLVNNHRDSNCTNVLESTAEGFSSHRSWVSVGLATAVVLGCAVLFMRIKRRR